VAGGMSDVTVESAHRDVHPWVAESLDRVRFAVVGNWLPTWEDTVRFVQLVEGLGFDAYWANDHPTRSMDCWTMLTALAGVTERIRLVSLVSCIYYRSPVFLARQAADVDRVSGGRLVLGLGIGDDVPEFDRLGLPFPPTPQRQRALDETLEIVKGLWEQPPYSFKGEFYSLDEVSIGPLPVQSPHVPVLIGGGGERTTLRQVAAHADVTNFGAHEWSGSAFEVADVRRKYEVLTTHCAAIGRDPRSILRSHYTPLLTLAPTQAIVERKQAAARIPDPHLRTIPVFATPDQAVAHFQALADAGVQYFMASVNGADLETVELLAREVLPALRVGPAPAARRQEVARARE
jgi:alkanesulfonate monooxygenase SsuD/methylene tetrahydromethanopterin reductase-like flavin-dependent oxidoreductase (luciferase family)